MLSTAAVSLPEVLFLSSKWRQVATVQQRLQSMLEPLAIL